MFSELDAATALARQFIPNRIKGTDWNSLSALCQKLGNESALRKRVDEALWPHPSPADRLALVQLVVAVCWDLKPTDVAEVDHALRAVLNVLARSFGKATLAARSPSAERQELISAGRVALLEKLKVIRASNALTAVEVRAAPIIRKGPTNKSKSSSSSGMDVMPINGSKERVVESPMAPSRVPPPSPAEEAQPSRRPPLPAAPVPASSGKAPPPESVATPPPPATSSSSKASPSTEFTPSPLTVTSSPSGVRAPPAPLPPSRGSAPSSSSAPPPRATATPIRASGHRGQREERLRTRSGPLWKSLEDAFSKLQAIQTQWENEPLSIDVQRKREEGIRALLEKLAQYEQCTPSPQLLERQEQAVARILEVLEVDSEALLPESMLQLLDAPSDLTPLLQSATSVACIDKAGLPSWLWPRVLPEPTHGSRVRALLALVSLPNLLRDLQDCADWLQAQAEETQRHARKSQEPASKQGSWLERLQQATLEREQASRITEEMGARLKKLAEFLSPQLSEDIARGAGSADAQQLLTRAEHLRERALPLKEVLHPQAWAEFRESLAVLAPASEDIVGELESLRVTPAAAIMPSMASLDALRKMRSLFVTVSPTPAEPMRMTPERQKAAVKELRHPMSRRSGLSSPTYSAELVWQPPTGAEPHGRTSLPVQLVLENAFVEDLQIHVEVAGDFVREVPAAWLELVSRTVLVVPRGTTRLDFGLVLPVTKLKAEQAAKERRNISLRLRLYSDRLVKAYEQEMSWQGLRLTPFRFDSPFHDNIPARVMEERPLGIERRFAELVGQVSGGDRSFLVCGPRRFGKTTLLKGLVEKASSLKEVAVLEPVVASGKANAEAIWTEVYFRLAVRFQVSIRAPMENHLLPPDEAFDEVRKVAAERGIKAIYILIDEAQALFSLGAERSDSNHQLGERLKQRLELSWGVAGPNRAAVRIGLVGQPHLPKLMGSNLLGAIPATYYAEPLKEEDLIPILRDFSPDGTLQSSAAARIRLAELSGNLYILNKLLDEVSSDCFQSHRTWFIEPDVERAVERLVERDRSGLDTTLWSYVRDALNESEDLKDWRPSETYPVALAWAKALEDPEHGTLFERAMRILRDWSAGTLILEARVEECVRTLRDGQVLRDDDTFQLPMLQRLLSVRATKSLPLREDREREALHRLGLRKVTRPPRAVSESDEPPHAGGQASVYRGREGDADLAVRCVRLDDAKAQQRFLREVQLLERLGEVSAAEHVQAATYLPKLVRMGFDGLDPRTGLVIYRWVEGAPLQTESLSELAAVTVGARLASVLGVLDSLQVVHRDIKPDNILIRTGTREPVLIDFGLGRAMEDLQNDTQSLAGVAEYLPPEVLRMGARAWKPQGDLFSLGRTLMRCLSPTVNPGPLTSLLKDMTGERPEARPSSREVIERFHELERRSQVDLHKTATVQVLRDFAVQMPRYCQRLVERAHGDVWACRLGLISRREAKLATIAEFLENVFEAFIATEHPTLREQFGERGGGTYLNRVRSLNTAGRLPTELRRFACSEAEAVGQLRNANAHSARFDAIISGAYRTLNQSRPAPHARETSPVLHQAVNRVTDSLGDVMTAPGLPRLVQYWLTPA